jgi:hypothetical protein
VGLAALPTQSECLAHAQQAAIDDTNDDVLHVLLQVADGSFDKFLSKFVAINTSGLGYVDLTQLAVYLASSSSSSSSADAKSGSRGSSRGSSNGSAAAGARGAGSAAAVGKARQSSAVSSAPTRLSTASRQTSNASTGAG